MWSAVSQLVAGVWAILTCPGHPPERFLPLVSPVPAYDARIYRFLPGTWCWLRRRLFHTCLGSVAAISSSDFNLPWLLAYDLLVGALLVDVVVRTSKFCRRFLGGGGGEVTADGGKALPPAPSGDALMKRECMKFRADFAGAEARIEQENRTGLESLHEIVQRCFDEHSRGIEKNLKI
ncbi:unnamed protein product [Ectocarpus sp. 6 AP-2014]